MWKLSKLTNSRIKKLKCMRIFQIQMTPMMIRMIIRRFFHNIGNNCCSCSRKNKCLTLFIPHQSSQLPCHHHLWLLVWCDASIVSRAVSFWKQKPWYHLFLCNEKVQHKSERWFSSSVSLGKNREQEWMTE